MKSTDRIAHAIAKVRCAATTFHAQARAENSNGGPETCFEAYHNGAAIAAQGIAENIAQVLESDNPFFDRAKFLKACGV